MSKFERGAFIGWDGEGATTRQKHRYILLASSAGDVRVAVKGAPSCQWLETLWQGLAARPADIHVGFAFSYDVNKILHSMPRKKVAELWHWGNIVWDGWRIRYRPHKEFAVHRLQGGDWVGGTVWDVFGFFQSSFVKALESYGVATDWQLRHIRAMKAKRASFHPRQLGGIRIYCELELTLLVKLMDKVRDHARVAGLTLRRWDGAGAVAADFFRLNNVLDHLGPDPATIHPRFPEEVRDAGQFAYYGGRIETLRIGHTKETVYQYDIRSAYPDAMRHLLSLAPGAGEWRRVTDWQPTCKLVVYRVRWDLSRGPRAGLDVFPFPWRAHDGAVFFPPAGESWVWAPELHTARCGLMAGHVAGSLEIRDGWAWDASPGQPGPFAFIPDMYALRAQWKAQKEGAEKILKLGLNSLYGKMAQQLGGSARRAPRYHSMELAGYVTSWVRARLTRAAWDAGPGAIMLATDALYTTVPLPLRVQNELGGWEPGVHQSGTFVQSGVYWVGEGDGELHHYRGFDPGSLKRAQVLRGWRRGFGFVSGQSERLVTMGRASQTDKAFPLWGQWVKGPRRLGLYPDVGQKRGLPSGVWRPNLEAGLVATMATQPTLSESRDGRGFSSPVVVPWRPLPGVSPFYLTHRLEAVESQDAELDHE